MAKRTKQQKKRLAERNKQRKYKAKQQDKVQAWLDVCLLPPVKGQAERDRMAEQMKQARANSRKDKAA